MFRTAPVMCRARVSGVLALALLAAVGSGCATITPVARPCPDRFALTHPGPEDIDIDAAHPEEPRLIISVQERRVRDRRHTTHYRGQILGVPLTGPRRGVAVPFTIENRAADTSFHPHGISLVQTPTGTLLYVVNHMVGQGGRIEVFAVQGDRLVAKPSLPETHLLTSPNDLVALRSGDVYVTNLTKYRNSILDALTLLFRVGTGSVVRYTPGRGWKAVATDIAYANGIAVTPAGDRVFVAGTLGDGIHVYDVDPLVDVLSERPDDFISLGTGADNLTWERPGETLIAARHPATLKFLRHARTPDRRSPSVILRVAVDGTKTVETVYADTGREISAASVGLVWDGRLYIGQVFNEGVLGCLVPGTVATR